MNKQKIRFLPNTWLDIINNIVAPGFLILILFFFEISEPVRFLIIESPTMITLLFVGTDLEFDILVVVICSNLYVGLVFLLFISCMPFDNLQSVNVES